MLASITSTDSESDSTPHGNPIQIQAARKTLYRGLGDQSPDPIGGSGVADACSSLLGARQPFVRSPRIHCLGDSSREYADAGVLAHAWLLSNAELFSARFKSDAGLQSAAERHLHTRIRIKFHLHSPRVADGLLASAKLVVEFLHLVDL